MLPGHLHSVVIVVGDENGNWDCIEDSLDTKKRLVNITFKKVVVVNCGDPLTGEGEAEFRVNVQEGATSAGTILEAFAIGNDEFVVRNGQEISVPWSLQIGPKSIVPELNKTISVHTAGFEYDGMERH